MLIVGERQMNKYFIAIVLTAASLLAMAATHEKNDCTITVKFQESPENAEIAGILGILDASQVTATFYAESLDAQYYEIWMVERRSSCHKRTKIGYKKIESDSTKLTFTAVAKDSLNAIISIVHLSTGSPRVNVAIPTADHQLIGCDFEWRFNENDTIPLVGYSTGIPQKFKLGNGQIYDGFHICGIRFSKINPYNWKEKYDLPDYLYFEAIPVKEINYDPQ